MENIFSKEEKRKFMFRKHIKDHLLEHVLDFIGPILLTALILYLCNAEEFIYGIILSVAYSSRKLIYDLYNYKKEYINIYIK